MVAHPSKESEWWTRLPQSQERRANSFTPMSSIGDKNYYTFGGTMKEPQSAAGQEGWTRTNDIHGIVPYALPSELLLDNSL